MKTVTGFADLTAHVVSDSEEIDRLRRFQMNRYFESGVSSDLPGTLPHDPLNEHSVYFGVYNDEEIVATARIVKGWQRLPVLEHHEIFDEVTQRLSTASCGVGEMSRLAVARNSERHQALAYLCREFFRYGAREGDASLLVGSITQSLARIVKGVLGIPIQIIGPPMDDYLGASGKCVPILLDTVECLSSLRLRSERHWDFFSEDLVIDLTDTTSTEDRVTTISSVGAA